VLWGGPGLLFRLSGVGYFFILFVGRRGFFFVFVFFFFHSFLRVPFELIPAMATRNSERNT
jgi:hypothetical protein